MNAILKFITKNWILIVVVFVFVIIIYLAIQKKRADDEQNRINSELSDVTKDVNKNNDNKVIEDDKFPLHVGSVGSNVTYLQNALNKLGAKLTADGKLGNSTYTAVLLYAGTKYWGSTGMTIDSFTKVLAMANAK